MHDNRVAAADGADSAIGPKIARAFDAPAQVALYSVYPDHASPMNPLRSRPNNAFSSPCGDEACVRARHLARLS